MLNQPNLYEQDFYAWTYQQANLLKQKKFDQIDLPNIIEELETLGRNEYREISRHMTALIMHLLKWQFLPQKRGNSWQISIDKQRIKISCLTEEMPSLKNYFHDNEWITKIWSDAVVDAANEMDLEKSTFPSEPIWAVEHILDENFYPNNENP